MSESVRREHWDEEGSVEVPGMSDYAELANRVSLLEKLVMEQLEQGD